MAQKAVFILWDTIDADPEQVYIGGGVTGVRWINQRVKVNRCRWSNSARRADVAAAKAYAATMTDKTHVRVQIIEES